MSESERKDEWVGRVLDFAFTRRPRGAVNYAKLLLEWRSAQQRALDSLRAFGTSFLSLQEVEADSRYPVVARALEGLPALVPQFGNALADHLDAAMSAENAETRVQHLREAVKTVANYRQQLASVPAFARLAGFAKRAVNLDMDVIGTLDQTLSTIEQEVLARISAAAV
jgi:hypothetical protein